MKSKNQNLRRKQLDAYLSSATSISEIKRPKQGWIREIREALGMTLTQFAQRLGVIKQRVSTLEHQETAGKVTLESMQKAANALNCDFIYFFQPRGGLEKWYQQQALKVAQKSIASVVHTMNLEQQSPSKAFVTQDIQELARKLADTGDKSIWENSHED